jgi:hypothetical protein
VPPLGRLALAVVVPALVTAGSLAGAAPASAAVSGTTSTADVVLYQHCQEHPITYDVSVDPGTTYWRLEIQVFDAKGDTSQGHVLTSADSPTHGIVTWSFCGSETPGTFTVRGSGFYENLPGLQIAFSLPDTRFEVRPMTTRTTLTRRPAAHGRYQLDVSVRQQSEHGFERANGIPVRLEKRTPGGWRRVSGLSLTTVRGKALATVRQPGAYRAVVSSAGNHGASTSHVVTVPR